MATYSVTTTPEQEAALSVIVAKVNAERAALDARNEKADPRPPLTIAQYLSQRFTEVLSSYVDQVDSLEREDVRSAWDKADPATRAAVKASLNLSRQRP